MRDLLIAAVLSVAVAAGAVALRFALADIVFG